MIDLCTVVFREEIETLRTQARSVSLYCQDIGIRSIYVVVNDDNEYANQIDPAWWGSMQHLVRIVPRSFYSTEYFTIGWVSQQVLKLQTAAISNNTWCMALDAKTFFVQPLQLDKLFDYDQPCVGLLDIYPVFDASRRIASEVWNIELTQQLGPGGVPFLFKTSEVRAMIADIELRKKTNFVNWFQTQGMLTEFILYSAWIEHRYGLANSIAESTICPVNICHGDANIDHKLSAMSNTNTTTVSVHRSAWPNFSAEQQQKYQELLKQKGLR